MHSLFVGASKSQLLDSLKVYLNKKNRLQPIIGLGSIIECVKVGTQNSEALYLCEVCVCRLTKADMRNHILGSLHRFSYIKAWHPHLASKWQDNWDLSNLAWPLMEMAKIIEAKEGPGDVQLLEVEDAVYQKIATHSENDALTLIHFLRGGQCEPESYSETTSLHYPIQSQRIVLLARDQQRWKSDTNESPPLTRANVAPTVKSEVWLKNNSTSQLDNIRTSPEPSVLPEKGNGFLDDYTGTTPLIGLFHVVEYRSEDGCSYCVLCHCCRIRFNKKDIIDHLTSSSHLLNYLMETHPEQVEVMPARKKDNCQLLQSLAKKVEQEEGRGELKVVNVPESLCRQLTGKSYHWCIKMLVSGWTHTDSQKKGIHAKGPRVNTTSVRGTSDKCAAKLSKRAKRKGKMKKVTDTVFNVSLPLTRGPVLLLDRTSFSGDSLPVPSASPSSDLDLTPSPESQIVDCELDCDAGEHASFRETPQLQQDLCGGGADVGRCVPERNITVTLFEDVNSYASDGVLFDQSEDSRERASEKFYENQKSEDDLQTLDEELLPAVSHTQDWSPHSSSYKHEEGFTDQWFNWTSKSEVGTRGEGSREERHEDMRSNAIQQHLQSQYMAGDDTRPLTGSVGGHHDVSGKLFPYLHATKINMQTHLGDQHAHSGSISAEPRVQFLETEQRRLQTYMEFPSDHVQTAPQSYWPQSTAYQTSQVHHGLMSYPNIGPRTNPDQHFAHPFSSIGTSGFVTQSNAFNQPGQALCYRAPSDLNFSAAGLSGFMISGSVDGKTPFMIAYPRFNSEYSAAPR